MKLLSDLKNYRVNLKDLEQELKDRNIEATPNSLDQLRIIIEYSDCII